MNKMTDITIRDELALERTYLAKERTVLAYARTGIAANTLSLAIIKLFDINQLEQILVIMFLFVPGLVATLYGIIKAFTSHRKYTDLEKKVEEEISEDD